MFGGWEDFLKGLGAAGLLIWWLMSENRAKSVSASEALEKERAAHAALILAKDDFAAKLLANAERSRADALTGAQASQAISSSITAMADALGAIKDRIPERRRSP